MGEVGKKSFYHCERCKKIVFIYFLRGEWTNILLACIGQDALPCVPVLLEVNHFVVFADWPSVLGISIGEEIEHL